MRRVAYLLGLGLLVIACGRTTRDAESSGTPGAHRTGGDHSGGARGREEPIVGGAFAGTGGERSPGGARAAGAGGVPSFAGGVGGVPRSAGEGGTAGGAAGDGAGGAGGAAGLPHAADRTCAERPLFAEWCEGSVRVSCDRQGRRHETDCAERYANWEPKIMAECLETNGEAGCAVPVGAPCHSTDHDDVVVLPCLGDAAACVFGPDGAVCVEGVHTCVERYEETCAGDVAVRCGGASYWGELQIPVGFDCPSFGSGAHCHHAPGDTGCVDLPVGAGCRQETDGNRFVWRCAEGLTCVGGEREWGECQR